MFYSGWVLNQLGVKMSAVKTQFEEILAKVQNKQVSKNPTQPEKLKLYAWFKQAHEGDVQGEEPSMAQFVERAKYKAWAQCKGMSQEEAMQAYIDFFQEDNA